MTIGPLARMDRDAVLQTLIRDHGSAVRTSPLLDRRVALSTVAHRLGLRPSPLVDMDEVTRALLADLTSMRGSGGGGGIPAWAGVLRDLVADPSHFLFAYNFASGGTGQGWNNVTEELMAVGECWEGPPWAEAFNTANIVNGLGLAPAFDSQAVLLVGILPVSVASGATLLIAAKAYEPVTATTGGDPFLHLVDLPVDNDEGGLALLWRGGDDEYFLEISNGEGEANYDMVAGKLASLRGACNYTVDGSDIVGSVNGRTNVTREGSIVGGDAPNSIAIHNAGATDVPVYLTTVAVFDLQNAAVLPSMSTLP